MARYDFGGTLADFVVTSRRLGNLDVLGLSAATLTFWSAQTGGTKYTDLQLNGSAAASISVGADGQVPRFQGPDGVTEMWADGGSPRIRIVTLQGAPGPAGPPGSSIGAAIGDIALDTDGVPYFDTASSGTGPSNTAVAGYVTAAGVTRTALDAAYLRQGGGPVTGPLLLKQGPIIDASKHLIDYSDGSPAGNVAALNGLFASRMGDVGTRKVRFTPLVGTGGAPIQLAGGLTATLDGLDIVGDSCELVQQTLNTKTLSITGCKEVHVGGLRLTGVGTEFQQSGGPSGASTSFNGTAGLWLFDVDKAHIERLVVKNHAGGGIRWSGTTVGLSSSTIEHCVVTGVGTAGGIASGDNRGDIGIGSVATPEAAHLDLDSNEISGHCFGYYVGAGKAVEIHGGWIHDIAGQHGIYLSSCSKTHVHHIPITNVPLIGLKNQISSTPTDVYDFVVDHVTVDGAQTAVLAASASAVGDAHRMYGTRIENCTARNVTQHGFYLTTQVGAKVNDNSVEGSASYGIYADGFSGEMCGNRMHGVAWDGIYALLYDDTRIEGNRFANIATGADGSAARSNHVYVNKSTDATITLPTVRFAENMFASPSGVPAGMLSTIRADNVGVIHRASEDFTGKGIDFTRSTALRTDALPPRESLFNKGTRMAESMARTSASVALAMTSGSEMGTALPVWMGVPISSLNFYSAVAATFGTNLDGHIYFCLRDASGNLLATTADQGATSSFSAGRKTLPLTTPYVPTADGVVYAFVCVVLGTGGTPVMPTIRGASLGSTAIGVGDPSQVNLAVTGATGVTGTPPATATFVSSVNQPFAQGK